MRHTPRMEPHDREKPFEQEWGTFLNEVRTALPGVQLLFGFLLAVPFTERFPHMQGMTRYVFFFCFLCTTCASAFLIAPSVYHRLHWRREVDDKERMFRTCNRLAIVGGILLALAMASAVLVLSIFILELKYAWVVSAGAAALFGWLWFGLPLSRRIRAEEARRE